MFPLTLAELQFNQPVTLTTDDTFLGYVTGRAPDDAAGRVMLVITISRPGKTDTRGCQSFAIDELVPVRGSRMSRGEWVR